MGCIKQGRGEGEGKGYLGEEQVTEQERLLAALEYQEAQRPALMNPNLMRQGQRMNLPARQAPGPMAEFVTQAMSLDPQPDQGLGTVGAEMGLSLVPGVGQAMGLRDIERGRRANDPVMMGLGAASLIPVGKLINALRGGKQMGPVSELDVYHGSPYRFPPTAKNPLGEFDPTRIGTGEGAQAYGHGLYLAEAPGVAKGYQIQNAYKAFDIGEEAAKRGIPLNAGGRGEFSRQAAANKGDPVRAAKGLQNANIAARSIPAEDLQKMFADYAERGGGSLYKVDLPDEQIAKMLDWDKPLSEQTKALDALNKNKDFAQYVERIMQRPLAELDGKTLQRMAIGYSADKGTGGASGAAELFKGAGIPGIRYLDQGSRGSQMRRVVDPDSGTSIFHQMKGGETADKALIRLRGKYPKAVIKEVGEDFGTSNFVVFPGGEKMLNILERQ